MFNNRKSVDNVQLAQDFTRLQKENQQLNLQVMQMTSQYYNAQKDANYYQNQYKVLEDAITSFCQSSLSNDYNTAQLGGNNILKNLSVLQLIDFTRTDLLKQKTNQLELIKRLKQENDFLNSRIIQLQNSLDNALEMQLNIEEQSNHNNLKDDSFGQSFNSEPVKITVERNDIPNANFEPFETQKTQNKYVVENKDSAINVSTTKKKIVDPNLPQIDMSMISNQNNNFNNTNNNKYIPQNIETIINTLTKTDIAVIETLGKKGFSESTDIVNYLQEESENKISRSAVMSSLTTLSQCQIIQTENIATGLRSQLSIYKLSNIGMQVFKEKFNEVPIKPDCDKIKEDHDNLKHGYNIKDCATQFEKYFECKNIEMKRNMVAIKLPDGETYIPDIIVSLKNKQTLYVEVELGNTDATPEKQENDFFKKCNKMFKITKTFFIVSDNGDTKKINDAKISNWIVANGGMGSPTLKGLTVYSATIRDLAKGQANIMKKPYIKIK